MDTNAHEPIRLGRGTLCAPLIASQTTARKE